MRKSELSNITPTAIYPLNDVFNAVQKDQADYSETVSNLPDWAAGYQSLAEAYTPVLAQLEQWKQQGVEKIVAEAPFSDSDLTCRPENTVIQQFRNNRVRPYCG